MTSPIDPTRRVDPIRRARRARTAPSSAAPSAKDFDERALPVPLEPSADRPRPPGGRTAAGAEFAAQLLGQDGQKRGLRGGPAVLDTARATYNRTEWSGTADRRAKAGRGAKTEI